MENNINKLLQSDNFSVHLFAETVNNLKNSQGYYSRLYENINNLNEYDLENFVTELTMQNFNDTLDVIMWLEGQYNETLAH